MQKLKQRIIREQLAETFEASEVDTVQTWLTSNEGRRPVVVVGAGFSRNARHRIENRLVNKEEMPLWGDLLDRFRNDLNLPQSAHYDALTLAELHREEMGSAAFHSILLEMTKDDDVVPEDAHQALFDYPAEAIVTTNLLDTLLDKNGQEWLRVVQDADLAIRKRGISDTELIYFHGHRHNRESWVLTRSQYEDIINRKPLIVTRVRQLLSQHPVLLVGFGLGDPDFHHIYRQISLDMSYSHPLGLALFPNGQGPNPSEVRHWGKLGIRVARFRRGLSTNKAFEKFFAIGPESRAKSLGATFPVANGRPSPTKSELLSKVKNLLLNEKCLAQRLVFAREFLSDASTVETLQISPYARYDLWLAVIKAEFTPEEWERINTIRLADEPGADGGLSATATSGQSLGDRFAGFKVLPASRFRVLDHLTRQIDAFLGKRGESRIELAHWMAYAWQQKLVNTEQPLFLDTLSWLCRTVIEAGAIDPSTHDAMKSFIQDSLTFAVKYNYPRSHILEDAEAIGIAISLITPASNLPTAFVQAMQIGLEKTLDGAFDEARDAYKSARQMAADANDAFGQWVALRGEFYAWASASDFRDQMAKEWQSAKDVYWRQIERLEQQADVRHWLDDADAKADRVKNMLVDQLISRRRRRLVGGRSMSFNNYTHEYWAIFRDLETIGAPPGLQKEYIQPLIDIEAFDVNEELGYRLRLGIDGSERTSDWISETLDDHACSLQDADVRNGVVLAELTRQGTTRDEKFRRLRVLPELAEIIRTTDLDWVHQFLLDCRTQFVRELRTHSGHRMLHDEHVKAWGAYAALEVRKEVVDRLEHFATTVAKRREIEVYAKVLRLFPFEQWVGMFECPDRLVRLVLDAPNNDVEMSQTRAGGHSAWALNSIVRGCEKFGQRLSTDTVVELRELSSSLLKLGQSTETFELPDLHNAAVHLAWSLAASDDERDGVVRESLARMGESAAITPERGDPGLDGQLGLWHSLVEAGADPNRTDLEDEAKRLWQLVDEKWPQVQGFSKNNPQYAWAYVAFLVDVLKLGDVVKAEIAQRRLLALLSDAPNELHICHDALDPKLWGDHWRKLVDLVWRCASMAGDAAVESRLGAVKLFRGWLEGSSDHGEPNGDLSFLAEIVLLSVSDERPYVANHAAYDVVLYAGTVQNGTHVDRVAEALRRISRDPRMHVRAAAAYAGTLFQHVDAAARVREVAIELDKFHSTEPYAVIQRQRRFGELDGRFPDKSRHERAPRAP